MKRCKCCKDKFEAKFPFQKYCMQKDICISKHIEVIRDKQKQQRYKSWVKKKKEISPIVYPKKFKGYLQDEINKLARMIDNHFGYLCIDCGKNYGKQQDAGHFKSVGSNPSLRFNLHNIHSQTSQCNRNGFGSGMERAYYKGLIDRYGHEYAEMVDVKLQIKYKHIGLKDNEIKDKLALVRKLIRDFDNYELEGSIKAREMFNSLIGIY